MTGSSRLPGMDAGVEAYLQRHRLVQWLVLFVVTAIPWTLIQLAVSDSTTVALLSGVAFGAVFATVFVLVRRTGE